MSGWLWNQRVPRLLLFQIGRTFSACGKRPAEYFLREEGDSFPMQSPRHLFSVLGIEIEYMVVDRKTLMVKSVVPNLLDAIAAESADLRSLTASDCIEWSNELVAHVAEVKCPQPVADTLDMLPPIKKSIARINALLEPMGCILMPSAAHPWMDPSKDAMLYPRDEEGIYREYDRIFGCNTHGWTNLQSVHINLPFSGDDEFGRLHAAIRAVLPLVPGIAAASPYLEGRFTGLACARMEYYRTNSLRVPSMTGELIPEPVYTEAEYRKEILERIYAETEPLDPKGILHDEWANARGAIARFDRNAIEIRVMDSQECPRADLAIAQAVANTVRLLCEAPYCSMETIRELPTKFLYDVFMAGVANAERALVPEEYAAIFGMHRACRLQDIWERLFSMSSVAEAAYRDVYLVLQSQGPLARRELARFSRNPSHAQLEELARELCRCLDRDEMFHSI